MTPIRLSRGDSPDEAGPRNSERRDHREERDAKDYQADAGGNEYAGDDVERAGTSNRFPPTAGYAGSSGRGQRADDDRLCGECESDRKVP